MSKHTTLTTSVKTVVTSGTDLAGLGAILSGFGTVAGALAVFFAAIVGTGTFRAWKRQQIIQRQMSLAEDILSAAYRSRAALQIIRSESETSEEIGLALEDAKKLGIILEGETADYINRVKHALIIQRRLRSYESLWSDLEILKAKGWANFDSSIFTSLNIITSQVDHINKAVEAYLDRNINGQDIVIHGLILKRLPFADRRSETDPVVAEMRGAVGTIKDKLKPVISYSNRQLIDLVNKPIVKSIISDITNIAQKMPL